MLDIENFTSEVYPQWHLGSKGQRVGKYFAGIDNFELLYPNFETKIKRKSSDGEYDREGDFKEVFLDSRALNNRNYESRYTYDSTFDTVGYEYLSEDVPAHRKIKIWTDSMGRAFNPFLSLVIENVDSRNSNQITKEWIEEEIFDMLIILLHASNVRCTGYFDMDLK